ncbi:MAG: TetR/AcrR family transcriptional regulator [Dysgonamonadaceae bacterium]|jgi:AcrR family transcriptional regulator|nr:TetR/AcrR family transcriptional regulator [Dysgonamonadaceae bacterium]
MIDNKEYIVKKSFPLFLKKSYKAVTLKDILAATGLSNGTFYYYFENKEQLFKEIVDHYMLNMTRRVFENYPKDSLYSFIRYTLDNYEKNFNQLFKDTDSDTNINFFSFIFEALRYFPELQQEMTEIQTLETNAWIYIIGVAKKNGEIRQDIPDETIARLFIYASDGNRMDYVLDNDFNLLKSRIKTLWYEFYNVLKT